MNLYRFLLHSSWVAIAITVFSPSSARSAENSRFSDVQNRGGVGGDKQEQTNPTSLLAQNRGLGSAADLVVSPRGINYSRETGLTDVGRTVEFVRPITESPIESQSLNPVRKEATAQNIPHSRPNIFQFIRNNTDHPDREYADAINHPRENLPAKNQHPINLPSDNYQSDGSQSENHQSEGFADSSINTGIFPAPSVNETTKKITVEETQVEETQLNEVINKKITNQGKIHKETTKQEINHKEIIEPGTTDKENINQETSNQETIYQETKNKEITNQEIINQETLPTPPVSDYPQSPPPPPENNPEKKHGENQPGYPPQPDTNTETNPDPNSPDTNAPESNKPSLGADELPPHKLQHLTLEQALEIAAKNNPDFQAALIKVQRGEAVVREAQAEWYPKLNLNGSLENTKSASDQLAVDKGVAPPSSSEAATQFTGQAEFRYSIFTSGRRSATIREAEEKLRIDKLDVDEKYQTLRLNTTLRYYDLQAADEQVRIGKSAVDNAQASLRDAQSLERAGVGTKFDVLRSQVNLANAQQDLTNSLSQQRISRRRLATILSLPGEVNLTTSESVKIAGLWEPDLQQTVGQAFEKRAELQQKIAERNVSEQRRRQALAAKGPQVDFVATYDLLDQYNDDVGASNGYSVGVKASLNLFDGGAARARAAQAKADIAIAETSFVSQRNQVRFEVEQFYSQLKSNQENVQTATLALEQATEALRLARLRFQAGVGTQTDVISAENDLTRAEGNRITAILDYNRALANLERAVAIHAHQK